MASDKQYKVYFYGTLNNEERAAWPWQNVYASSPQEAAEIAVSGIAKGGATEGSRVLVTGPLDVNIYVYDLTPVKPKPDPHWTIKV